MQAHASSLEGGKEKTGKEEKQSDDGGCSHTARNTDSHRRLEETRNGFSPGASRGSPACQCLDSDLCPPRTGETTFISSH